VIPEVNITAELLSRHAAALDTIRMLGTRYGPGRWVLVGGMMVMILGREHDARAPRAEGTKDADILVDIATNPNLLADVANFLETSGYQLQADFGDGRAARCSFAYYSAHIDVLCPDDTPDDQLVVVDRNVASIAIPGGRRAFDTARPVSLHYADDRPNAEIYVPSLAGAIAVKTAAAVDPRTARSPRHLQDVAFLLTIEADPDETRAGLNANDIDLLRQIDEQVSDSRTPMWLQLDAGQRQVAQATYEVLTAPSE
jgi:hypothetical protein